MKTRLLLATAISFCSVSPVLALSLPPQDGELMVQVQQAALQGSIPQGAQRVPILNLKLTASCIQDVAVESLSIKHFGLGATSDFSRVYVFQGTKRVSRTATFPLRDPLNLSLIGVTVPACKTVELQVLADLSAVASAASEHRFQLSSVTTKDAVPVRLTQSTSSSAATVTVNANPAQVSAELLSVLQPIYYGANQTVARLALTGQGGKDQRVVAITFENRGSASNADLRNFTLLTVDGKTVSKVTSQMDGRMVRLELDPSFILQGRDRKLLLLKADVRASRRRTIEWRLNEADIEAVELRTR